jgi:hypothetical protein
MIHLNSHSISMGKKTHRKYMDSISYNQTVGGDTQMGNIFTFVCAVFATFQ